MSNLSVQKNPNAVSSKEQLKDLVEYILSSSKQKGATDCEVGISVDSGLSTTVRLGEVDTMEFHRDKGIGITVYKGKKKGNVSISDLKKSEVDEAINAAIKIASFTEEDEFVGLADKNLMATEFKDLDLYHPREIKPEDAISYAKTCENAARSVDKKITNSDGASFSNNNKLGIYGNSYGFIGETETTSYSLSCVPIALDNGVMQRDYDYTMARDFKDLTNFTQVGISAAKKTLARLNSRKINTCKVPVIFSANQAPKLFSTFTSAISGGNLYRKTSFLLDSLNTKIFPDHITMTENPFIPKAFASCNYDAEGVAVKQHDLIKSGVLTSYILSSYSARKLGMQTTGNAGGVHNLLVSHGEKDFDLLVKSMDKGLVVTETMGHGTNIVTGDYSMGASGFWVESGTIQYPVHEITIAGNLKDMFANIIEIANDVEKRTNIRTGSVLIEQMTIAGN